MKKNVLLLLLLLPALFYSQVYERRMAMGTYSSTTLYGRGVCKKANGNYLLCTTTGSNSALDMSVIAEIDAFGDTVWTSRIKLNGGMDLDFIKERPDGKIVIAGASGGNAYKYAWVGLASNTGSLISSLYLATFNLPTRISDVEIGPDNSIYICGHASDVFSGGVTFHRWYIPIIAKINSSCSAISWSKTYGQHNGTTRRSGVGCDLEMAPDGNLIFGGTYNWNNNNYFGGSGPQNGYAYLAKLSSSTGNTIWSKERVNEYPGVGGSTGNKPWGLAVSPGGFIYMTRPMSNGFSSSNVDIIISKCSPTGDSLWTMKYGTSTANEPADLDYDPAGRLTVVGEHSNGSNNQFFLMRFDTMGTLLNANSFMDFGGAENLCRLNNGKFVLSGSAYFSGYKASTVVTDSAGVPSCYTAISGVQSGTHASGWSSGTTTYNYSLVTQSQSTNTVSEAPSYLLGCYATDPCSVSAGYLASGSVFCPADVVSFNNVSGGGLTYRWYDNGALFSTATSPSLMLSSAGIHTVMLIATGASCSSVYSGTLDVSPTPTIAITGSLATCIGNSMTLTASGASTYTWSTGDISNVTIFTPTAGGSYTAVGTNTGGCSNFKVVTVTVNPLPTVGISGNTISCQGVVNPLVASGASTYTWSTGSTSSNLNVTTPSVTTTYSVVGRSTLGCTISASHALTSIPWPTVTISGNNTICAAVSTTLTASGADTYTWSNTVQNESISVNPVSTTNYSVTGTDASTGCKRTVSVQVVVKPLPNITVATTNTVVCFVGQSATLTASNGTAYLWSDGSTTNSIVVTPSATTAYSVTGTGTNGCSNSTVRTVSLGAQPNVTINPASPSACAGKTVALSASGANTYTWSTGQTGANITITPSATAVYSVTGRTSSNLCTNTNSVTVTVNPLPTVAISASSQTTCAGGTVTLSGSGANTYSWTGGVSNGTPFTPTTSGNYTVTGTDLNGCQKTATISLTVTPLPVVTASTTSTLVCQGQTVILTGGGAATYTWSGGVTDGVPFSPMATAGYTVSGTNLAGCTSTNTAGKVITVNAAPNVTANASSLSLCLGNTVVLTGSGATTYTWSGGISNGIAFTPTATTTYSVIGTGTNACVGSNSAAITVTVNPLPIVGSSASSTSVCPGGTVVLNGSGASTYTWTGGVSDGVPFSPASTASYSLMGTDASGCTSTNSAVETIVVNAALAIAANASSPSVCAGNTVVLNGSGATTYTWSGGISDGVPFTPTATASYTLTGADASGCQGTAVKTITVNPLPLIGASASSPSVCAGGTVVLNGTGASTYTWTGGITNGVAFTPASTTSYSVTGSSAAGCTGTNAAVITITVNALPVVGISAGNTVVCSGNTVSLSGTGASTYTWSGGISNGIAFTPASTTTYSVIGTDAAGCTSTNTAAQTISVNPLPVVGLSAGSTVVCLGGTVSLSGSGASTYTWSGGITNGVPFTPTATVSYTVNGTNVAGCTSTNSAVQTISVNPLPLIGASASSPSVCAGNTVVLNGTGASTYTWTGGITNGVAFTPASTTSYSVTGSSAAGCTGTNVAVMTITVNALPIVGISASNTVVCLGNTVALSGTGASTYTWSGGISNGIAFTPASTTTYSVIGTDAAGCTSTNTAAQTISVNPLPVVGVNVSSTVVCLGGTVSLSGSGASTYTWSGGITNGVAFTPTATASYTVNGTNAAGCTSTNSAGQTILVNPLPVVVANASSPSVCATNSVVLSGSGASTYTWTGGISNGVAFTPASTTNYTVTGTDLNGCRNTATKTITVNPLPSLTVAMSSSSVCMGGTVSLTASGASTYTWTGGVINGVPFSPTATANYTVTGANAFGCQDMAVRGITVNPVPVVFIVPSTSTGICIGASVSLLAGGAASYTWSTSQVSVGITVTPAVNTTYSVLGSASGCTASAFVSFTVNPLPVITASASNNAICNGGTVSLTGGGASTYTWTGGVNNGVPFTPTSTASYTVTGTSAAGCTGTNTVVQTITVNPLPVVTASASSPAVCIGNTVVLNGGGASTYTWTGGVTNGVPFTPTATASYSVSGTSTAGCTSTNITVQTITVNPLPVVTASASNTVICIGNTVTLNGGGASTYTWTGGVANGVPFTPTATASYSVSGTSTAGCTSTNVVVQTITVNPLPVITASASNTVICFGNTVTLNGGGASTYTWTGGVNNGVPFTPTSTASYTVTGTSTAGCTGTNVAVQTITVNPLPVVTASASSLAICAGNTVVLNGGGASTYTWTGGVTNGVPFTPTATASYSVSGTSTAGCTSTNMAVQTITVNALPVVTASAGSTAICFGNTVVLNGGGADTYSWTGGITNNTAFTPTATASYSVTGTNTLTGCTSTNTAVGTITVNLLPVVTANASSTVICFGNTVTLSGGGASTYAWSSGVINGMPFSPTTTADYSVTGTSVDGCTATVTQTIVVNTIPVISIVSTSTAVCLGGTVALSGNGALTYTWTGGITNGVPFTPTATASYSVSGTSTAGCMGAATAMQTILVNLLPSVTANASSPAVCLGNTVILTGGGAQTYTWSGGVSNGVAFSPTSTASYTVNGTDMNGCRNTAVQDVTVNPLPSITAVTSHSMFCENPAGQTATLTATGATSYVWNPGGAGSSIVVSPTTTTNYTVTGTDANNCGASTVLTQVVSPCTGIAENSLSGEITLYPNPMNGFAVLRFPSGVALTSKTEIRIYNSVEQLIVSRRLTAEECQAGEIGIRLDEQDAGMYFIYVSTAQGRVMKKLIKD